MFISRSKLQGLGVAIVLLLGAVPALAAIPAMPGGIYTLDKSHTSVVFKINHWGFSHFTGRFDAFEGTFDYKPDTPEQSSLDITLYPNSIDTNDSELDEDLRGANWFDTIHFPRARFRTTGIQRTGDNSATITGDFTLHGATHPVVLQAVLVGAGVMPVTDDQVMGFSATGSFKRSDYGINNLEPMIGDEVALEIDTEFDKEQ